MVLSKQRCADKDLQFSDYSHAPNLSLSCRFSYIIMTNCGAFPVKLCGVNRFSDFIQRCGLALSLTTHLRVCETHVSDAPLPTLALCRTGFFFFLKKRKWPCWSDISIFSHRPFIHWMVNSKPFQILPIFSGPIEPSCVNIVIYQKKFQVR